MPARMPPAWAVARDDYTFSVRPHLPPAVPSATVMLSGAVTANLDRPDVNAAFGITGLHGFNFQIPTSFRDGRTHTLFAHGIDNEEVAENRLLEQSGMRFTLSAPRFQSGVLDGITPIGI